MSTAPRLWQIADELDEIAEQIAEAGGELTPELEARLDALDGAFEEKVERVALVVRERIAWAEGAKLEEERLGAIRRCHERAADGLKRYLLQQMQRTDHPKVETPRARVRVQKNSQPSIAWTRPVEELPDVYRRVTVAPDLARVREDLKAGAGVPEGFTVEQGFHIRIQ